MKSVLKPDGIIRTNFHSSLQRAHYFRAQSLFNFMGLMEQNLETMQIDIVRDIMKALKDNVLLKFQTWDSKYEKNDGGILANHLLMGDKGSTIPEFFSALRAADLEFIKMVNWWQWDVMNLFKEPDNLPTFLAMSLPELSVEEKLHLFELLHPVNRLLDLWCGHPNQISSVVPIEEWTDSDWQKATVHLHPQLKTPNFREDLVGCVMEIRAFPISQHLALIEEFVSIDSAMAVCLLPLLEQPQSMICLMERWLSVRPLDPITVRSRRKKNLALGSS